MPRIRCHYEDCVFLEEEYCDAAAIELDPDQGCLTYSSVDDVPLVAAEGEWADDEFDEEWEEEEGLYEEDEELEDDLTEEDDDDEF